MMSIAGHDGWRSTELDMIYSVGPHHVERGAALGKPAHYALSARRLDLFNGLALFVDLLV